MSADHILQLLQDVDWVVGSFVCNDDGQLLLYQMPADFAEERLRRTTSRLASIVRCAELCDLAVEQCDFSLNRYQLVMKRFQGGMLCVMVEAPVSRRALNMATRIALEELPDVVEALVAPPRTETEDEPTSRYRLPDEQELARELTQQAPRGQAGPSETVARAVAESMSMNNSDGH